MAPTDRPGTPPQSMGDAAPRSNKQKKQRLKARRAQKDAPEEVRPDPATRADAAMRRRRAERVRPAAATGGAGGGDQGRPAPSAHPAFRDILSSARDLRCESAARRLIDISAPIGLLSARPDDDERRIRFALIHMARAHAYWRRPPEEWQPRTHNRWRRVNALLRWLFADYDVPAFMDNGFFYGVHGGELAHGDTCQRWFRWIGSGKNLRKAPDLPIRVTRRVAHEFLQAPDDFVPGAALRFAEIQALGGDRRVALALARTRAGDVLDVPGGVEAAAFWESVVRWFIAAPMLDAATFGGIVDWIVHERFVHVRQPDGTDRPMRPNLSMKGRTVDSVLRAVDAWHGELARTRRGQNLTWAPTGISASTRGPADPAGRHRLVTGSKRRPVEWEFLELLSSRELQQEGRAHGHCVLTYAQSCVRGRASIWSLRRLDADERVLTLEVQPQQRRVVQIRGRHNRLPTSSEWSLIQEWCRQAGLSLPDWLPRR